MSERLYPNSIENSHTIPTTIGSQPKQTLNCAKSTCACLPADVSKRRSKLLSAWGRTSRK